jgi:hypothetical protein
MNEKERYEHLNETLSLVITPLVKEVRRNLRSLFILNILGNIILISLVSAMIALLLIQGV